MPPEVTDDVVVDLARAAVGRPDAAVAAWSWVPVGHRIDNLCTHGLDRLTGTLVDGAPWSVFAKTLHPASDSPSWAEIPEVHRAQVLVDLHWLDEPRVYRSGLAAVLPSGLRLPAVLRIDERPTRTTLWLEDVVDRGRWDLARYRRTAHVLGRMAGRVPEARAAGLGLARRDLGRLFAGKVQHLDLPLQAGDGFWEDPEVAAAVDRSHRRDLERLATAVPALLRRLEALPHGLAHGDAAPDNLLEPGDGTVVAIDWSYGSIGALGSDLGQLLAGRAESGALDADDLAPVAEVLLDGYLSGLAAEGTRVDPDEVEEAWATNLAVRSVFSALVVDLRPDRSGGRAELLARRAALGRFGLDLVQRVLCGAGSTSRADRVIW